MRTLRERLAAPFENPVLRRELVLVTRRGRFEWAMFLITVAMTLVIASVGGRSSAGLHPAYIGKVLFQTFFGTANGLVMVIGPAVAANSIASEREGRTYEALALTGIQPSRVAAGKFLAAFTHVASYVIALAPVGALPFLFGGVSALAVVYAFGMLFVITALAVLFGLAISARLPTTRSALITSTLGGAALAVFLYVVVGETVGTAVCDAVGVASPGTIWLPVVLADGSLRPITFAALFATPLVLALLIGWFMFEVCTANLSDPSADRSTGLKRWFVVAAATLALIGCGVISAVDGRIERATIAIDAIATYAVFAVLAAFVFQGDAIYAPRRVRLLWKARRAGIVRRFLGPGMTASAALQLGAAAVVLGAMSTVGMIHVLREEYGPASAPLGIVAIAFPTSAFVLFVVGLSASLRVRWGSTIGRAVLAITLLVVVLAPYAVTTILGNSGSDPDSIVPLLAAASPLFDIDVARRVASDQADSAFITAGILATAVYAFVGLALLVWAALRTDRIVSTADADAERMDALIAREDAADSARTSAPVSTG